MKNQNETFSELAKKMETLKDDSLDNLKGGFALFSAPSAKSIEEGTVSVSVTGNCSCTCTSS